MSKQKPDKITVNNNDNSDIDIHINKKGSKKTLWWIILAVGLLIITGLSLFLAQKPSNSTQGACSPVMGNIDNSTFNINCEK